MADEPLIVSLRPLPNRDSVCNTGVIAFSSNIAHGEPSVQNNHLMIYLFVVIVRYVIKEATNAAHYNCMY